MSRPDKFFPDFVKIILKNEVLKIEKRSLDCYNDQNMWPERRSYPRKELLQPSELKGIFETELNYPKKTDKK